MPERPLDEFDTLNLLKADPKLWKQLTVPQAEACRMFLSGMVMHDIADILGKSKVTVFHLLRRSRARLMRAYPAKSTVHAKHAPVVVHKHGCPCLDCCDERDR